MQTLRVADVWKEAKPLVEFCHQNGIRIAAYSPQAPLVYKTGGPVDAVVESIAKDLSITPGQVLLKWAMQAGDFIVTTSSKPDRIKEMLAVADLKDLSQAQFDEIAEAGSKLSFRASSPFASTSLS